MSKRKGLKKGLNFKGGNRALTPRQATIYRLRIKDGLNARQIARTLNISLSAVYSHITNIKKKGFFSHEYKGVENFDPTCQPPLDSKGLRFRLHAQHWIVRLITITDKYRQVLKRSNALNVDGNTVMLHKNSIQVYSNKDFWSSDPDKAVHDSMKYWSRFALRLENDLGLVLIKNRVQNWKLVSMHVAEVDNELAKDYDLRGDKLQVFGRDGKLWALIDNSFNLREFETVSGTRAVDDMRAVQRVFNDYRSGAVPLPSEVWLVLAKTLELQREQAASLSAVTALLKAQFDSPVVDFDLSEANYFG